MNFGAADGTLYRIVLEEFPDKFVLLVDTVAYMSLFKMPEALFFPGQKMFFVFK